MLEPIAASVTASQNFICVGGALNIPHMRSSKMICKLQAKGMAINIY